MYSRDIGNNESTRNLHENRDKGYRNKSCLCKPWKKGWSRNNLENYPSTLIHKSKLQFNNDLKLYPLNTKEAYAYGITEKSIHGKNKLHNDYFKEAFTQTTEIVSNNIYCRYLKQIRDLKIVKRIIGVKTKLLK